MIFTFYLDIAALLFIAVYYIFLKIQYTISERSSKLFRVFLCALFIANLLDILGTLILFTDASRFWKIAINTLFYSFEIVPWWIFLGYVCTLFDNEYRVTKRRKKPGEIIGISIFAFYQIMVLTTPLTKFIFYIDENGLYQRGSQYYLMSFTMVYYLLIGIAKVIKGRDKLNRKQVVSILTFAVITEGGALLQGFVFKEILMFFFTAALASFLVLFSLETPDYVLLTKTLEELRAAKKAAEEAEKAADEANNAKSEFLANMSHEVRTPLNGILGMTDIALDDDISPQTRESLMHIKASGQGLLAIINDILDISKIESGKMELVPAEFRLNDLVEGIENILRDKIREKGLKYKLEYEKNLPNVYFGDEKRIRQIVINLLTNAVKYTDEGSVCLSLKHEKLEDDNVNLYVSIKDTGIGIKEDDLKKLFSSFTRLDLTRNRSVEGTGLGLSIVKELLELMGGEIKVESVYKEGSNFTAKIPLKIVGDATFTKENQIDKVSATVEVDDLSHLRVLVVDDVMVNLKVISGLLRKTNIVLDSVLSGAECIELMKTQKYDMVLLDHMMPEMDGIEVLNRLKELGDYINAKTPIVVLTANAIEGQKEMYLKEGFTDYLSKPVNRDKLIEMIKQYC